MKRILTTLLLATLSVGTVSAQARLQTAKNVALGGGGTAYIDSYEANFLNPANIMLRTDRKTGFTIGLSSVSLSAGGPLANITTYNEYLTKGLTLSTDLTTAMLDDWFGGDPEVSTKAGLELNIVGFGTALQGSNWAASLAIRNRVITNLGVNRGLPEVFFYGLDPAVFGGGRAVNMNMDVLAFTEVSLGYSRHILNLGDKQIFAGIAPKLLMGHNTQSLAFNSVITANNGNFRHRYDYTIQTLGSLADGLTNYATDRDNTPEGAEEPEIGDYIEPAASDFAGVQATSIGFDLGATMIMPADFIPIPKWGPFKGERQLIVGLSITDIGKLNFSDATQFVNTDEVFYSGFNYDKDLIDAQFDGDFGSYAESVLKDSIGTEAYLDFSPDGSASVGRALPTTLNLGTQLRMGRFGLMLDVGKGLNDTGVNSTNMYMALGTEYRFFGFLPLRMGMRTGGYSSTTYHFGTGLEFKHFEFSFGAASSTSSEKGAGISTAFSGLVFHF
jgi:hypothetical protein